MVRAYLIALVWGAFLGLLKAAMAGGGPVDEDLLLRGEAPA